MTINNGDNTVTELEESANLPTHISHPEQQVIIKSLKDVDPISYHYYFNFFIGKTRDGYICYYPESFRKGYLDFLDDKELSLELELYAIGQTSTGEWVYLPSYFQGVYAAKNDLRFALLAEGQRRLFDDTKKGKQELQKQVQSCEGIIAESSKNKDMFSNLQRGYDELVSENKNLRLEIGKQQELADAYKKEIEEFRSQLQEVRNMFIETERRHNESSTSTPNINERKGYKRKGAAPIS
jgi:hypothetical protein